MDNINVGYTFGKILHNIGTLTVTGNVQNVFVVTQYKGLDPEINGGIDNNFYPRPRTYSMGALMYLSDKTNNNFKIII